MNIQLFILCYYSEINITAFIIFPIVTILFFYNYQNNLNDFNGSESYNTEKIIISNKILVLVLFVAITVISIFEIDIFVDTKDNKTITIVNDGFMVDLDKDFENNIHSGYGYNSSVFGSLPFYTEIFGFDTDIVSSMQSVNWGKSDCVILINYNKKIEYEQIELIKNYVKNGGSLLIFCDHTNIGNNMKSINPLLVEFGIVVNDDTADPILHFKGRGWDRNVFYSNNVKNTLLKKESDSQIWGGASLSFHNIFRTETLVYGKYAFSDASNPENAGMGGYLGNRKLDLLEKVGDISLVTQTKYGYGKVIVFGDTSPIQIPVLTSSWKYIASCMTDLTSKGLFPFANLFIKILCISLFIICLVLMKKDILELFIIIALVSLVISSSINVLFGNDRMDIIKSKIINNKYAMISDMLLLIS